MTSVTPIRQPPLETLRNAMQVCLLYEDPNLADSDAKKQLPRIRALIAQVIAQLSEPHQDTIDQTQRALVYFYGMGYDEAKGMAHVHSPSVVDAREARDAAAVILNSAMTWGIGSTL